MLYVRVELWPKGDRARARVMGEAIIANQGGSRDATRGAYVGQLLRWGRGARDVLSAPVWKSGRVENFPRKALGPWDLLYRVLGAIVADRNRSTPRPRETDPSIDERSFEDDPFEGC